MEIAASVEQSIGDLVTRHLETELGDRGLLLTADGLAAAEADAARRGAHLRTRVMHQCYPMLSQGADVRFADDDTSARLDAALAFGAATARVLAARGAECDADAVELLCATFNLGIGLVDGVCDADAETGAALLELLHASDVATAAEAPRPRGWLRAAVPPRLAQDPTVAFTADVIEAFFETLHTVHPGDGCVPLRRRVGAQLGAALDAERRSILPRGPHTSWAELAECSRLTSVLPFQIIETLAGGDQVPAPTAGRRLGEAMWRIDDLVDLCQDARRGALNAILLAAATGPDERDVFATLLDSNDIADAAADAAEKLRAELQPVGDVQRAFLYFIQRYAALATS